MNMEGAVKELSKLTKKEMEDNIKVSGDWLRAIRASTVRGGDAPAVASLIGFLEVQHEASLKAFEAESLNHPEWGNK